MAKKVTNAMNYRLNKVLIDNEIKEVIFATDPNKALGSNGFTSKFF